MTEPTARTPPVPYQFTLFVIGATPRSMRALANVQRFCANELGGKYVLEVVDLYVHPERAQADQIVAVPTLVRHLPRPLRYAIGDLSDTRALRATIGAA
ncbi:MAG: circadian clock KaiB family protein [Nitrobacter sp.]